MARSGSTVRGLLVAFIILSASTGLRAKAQPVSLAAKRRLVNTGQQSPSLRAGVARRLVISGPASDARETTLRLQLQQNPQSAELRTALGAHLWEEGKISESLSVLLRDRKTATSELDIAFIALDYCAIDDQEHARPYLNRLSRMRIDLETRKLVAPCYLQAGDAMDAVRTYSELLAADPHANDEVSVGLTRSYFRLSKESLAKLEDLPGSDRYLAALKRVREGAASAPDGEMQFAYQQAKDLGPDHSLDHLLFLFHQHAADPAFVYLVGVAAGEHAMALLDECQRQFPDSISLRRFEAEMMASQGDYNGATELLRTMVALAPDNPELRRDLGLTLYRTKDYSAALEQFQGLLTHSSNSEEARVAVSKCLIQLGKYAEDLELLRPVMKSAAPAAWALLDWASAEQALGHVSQAITALKTLETRNPRDASVHYRLARLYKASGDTKGARRESEAFRKLPRESEQVSAAEHDADLNKHTHAQ